jgi:large subunit ribosomal protein L15
MKLHDLKPAPGSVHKSKRVGRGHGSGKGKTSGKGMMGQKARSGPNPYRTFEGGQNRIVRRMPYLRGFKNRWRVEYQVLNVGELNDLPTGEELTVDVLVQSGVISAKRPLKILGDGELTTALNVHAHKFSASARAKIEAAGGSVTELPWLAEKTSRSRGPNLAQRNRKDQSDAQG